MGLPGRQRSVRLMNFEPIFVDSQSHDFCVKGSFKIATICDSVNLDFLMTSPVPGESTIYLYPSRGEPTISMRQYHYRETNLPNLRSCRDGRRHRHAQFPARQQVCPKDAPGSPLFRPDAARLTRC